MVAGEALGADEFAFYFRGENGVEAKELGDFLRRAATVARREGVELRVTALHPGSLAVIVRALQRSHALRAVRDEFKRSPVQVAGAGATLVAVVVGALARAMTPDSGPAEPLAKAGAEIVEKHQVEQIEIITQNQTIVVMDLGRALQIREVERHHKKGPRLLPATEVRTLQDSGRAGTLTGHVVDVEGELHFRPDGYRYLVPIDVVWSEAANELHPGTYVRINADLKTRSGQPDTIQVHKAVRIH